jgi:hypothetical protein
VQVGGSEYLALGSVEVAHSNEQIVQREVVRAVFCEWFVASNSFRSANCYGLGKFARKRSFKMKHGDLETCIATLIELRARKHKELDASLVVELDAVIEQLERCSRSTDGAVSVSPELRIRALEVIGQILCIATNLAELIKACFGPQ